MAATMENLYLLKDLATKTRRIGDDLPALKTAADWIRDYICQEDTQLGRAVCPFVPPAIDHDVLWLAPERVRGRTQLQMSRVMDSYKDLFLEIAPKEKITRAQASLVVVFPDVSKEDSPKYVDEVQRVLKDSFVEEGLMLGEFHPLNQTPSVYNEAVFPNRSPVPMLAIRHMVITDWHFLLEKDEWIQAWLARFHAGVTARDLVRHLKALIKKLEELEAKKEPLPQPVRS